MKVLVPHKNVPVSVDLRIDQTNSATYIYFFILTCVGSRTKQYWRFQGGPHGISTCRKNNSLHLSILRIFLHNFGSSFLAADRSRHFGCDWWTTQRKVLILSYHYTLRMTLNNGLSLTVSLIHMRVDYITYCVAVCTVSVCAPPLFMIESRTHHYMG